MILTFSVILHDHMNSFSLSPDLYGWDLKVTYTAPKFDSHKHCGSTDIMVLVFHTISQDHMIKMSGHYE